MQACGKSSGWRSSAGALGSRVQEVRRMGLVSSVFKTIAWGIAGLGLALGAHADPVEVKKDSYLELARRGWSYELRTTMLGRDPSIPVHINGRDLSGASICLVGDPPGTQTRAVLDAFRALAFRTFEKPLPMRYAGPDARRCGSGRTVILRLYSGFPPHGALTRDLEWMNTAYALGLPSGRRYYATSPAMAQTFFGRRGQGTHILVQQSAAADPAPLEAAYHRSILIEELFQAFTFGMDILELDRTAGFLSKLQETPIDMQRLPWGSDAFMHTLLESNPRGLCPFDIFMLHAVARAPVDQTVEPAFISFIERNFDQLDTLMQETLADPRFASIVDPVCGTPA
jgi:hypothetical protein